MTQQWADAVWERIVQKYLAAIPHALALDVIPYGGKADRWEAPPIRGNGWWTSGFWPGQMWLLYAATRNPAFEAEALRTQGLIVAELDAFDALSHDVGFQFLLSTGAHHRLTGDRDSLRQTLHAATLLAGRFNPHGFLRAWNPAGKEGWAIVDSLMNLPLLYWASRQTGDPRFTQIAQIHADTALQHFVRPDGSCHHIVVFDPDTGEVSDTPAGQGCAPGSSWSRGQAWALYGFVLSYRWTGAPRYLDAAKRIAHYFIANIRADGLTDCDFRQPATAERLDNIAGACAACALLDLSAEVPGAEGALYRQPALRLLQALDAQCADYNTDIMGILQRCTAAYAPDPAGEHINMVYGDYFLTEAVAKLRKCDPRFWG